jgi:hypothetical protein
MNNSDEDGKLQLIRQYEKKLKKSELKRKTRKLENAGMGS